MGKSPLFVGLDAHKDSIAVAHAAAVGLTRPCSSGRSAKSTPGMCRISLTGWIASTASPRATMATDSVPRVGIFTAISLEMPSRERTSVIMEVLLPGTAIVFARSNVCLKASTVLMSGFGPPARRAKP
jgi:hypothetical protein